MPDTGVRKVAQGRKSAALDDLERRAVTAWNDLTGDARDPLSVETLQHESARTILRLRHRDDGSTGYTVIAKRCRTDAALKERAVYADVLPRLPFPSLRLHGVVTESDTQHAWLFMEDADAVGRPYDPRCEEHRVAAGRWLGVMHTAAASLAAPLALGDRGPQGFREDLQRGCTTLDEVRANRALTSADVAMLNGISSKCRLIASHWGEIEDFCSRLPRTLVHGDFKEAHIRIRTDRGEPVLLLFDWGESGWGVPGLDVAKFLGYSVRPELSAYQAVVSQSRPSMTFDTIVRLGFVGDACRCIASIRWEAEKLCHEWVERPLSTLRVYSDWMDEIVGAEPWVEQACGGPETRVARPRTWY